MNIEPTLAIYLIGLLLIITGGYKWYCYNRLRSWETTKAVIEEISFQETRMADTDVSVTVYIYPEILYRFVVGGVNFSNSSFSPEFMNYACPREEFEKKPWSAWKSGMEINIWYNQRSPQQAYVHIEPSRIRISNYRALVVSGIIVLAFGLIVRSLNA